MSRSRRYTPIAGIAGSPHVSEKKDKRLHNRAMRRINKVRVQQEKEPLVKDEVTDLWLMNKDGKFYFDQKKFPKLMRK